MWLENSWRYGMLVKGIQESIRSTDSESCKRRFGKKELSVEDIDESSRWREPEVYTHTPHASFQILNGMRFP